MIENRLRKNFQKLKGWASQNKIEAYRLYDRDIPEFPYIVDRYKDYFVVYDRTDEFIDKDKDYLPQVCLALKNIFAAEDSQVILKKRARQRGDAQYAKLDLKQEYFWVREAQAQFRVNLFDYLDTGLFLDHRPMRQKIFKISGGKKFLNLFCYTGAVSVFAALAGAQTTSVDMSPTYLSWAKENFRGNGLELTSHLFIQENCIEYLSRPTLDLFDLIFLDPPTFSNSKRMDGDFEVEKDQDFLIDSCMKRLRPDGILYFSTNKRRFKLSGNVFDRYQVKDISMETIPKDFHDQKIHQCFEIKA